MSEELTGRRPLKVRNASLSIKVAQWLSQRKITPNQISIASVFFSLLAGVCFLSIPSSNSAWPFALLAALFIQLRLLCNLFDGMVAVEGGKITPAGELFNDIPDRIADPLILVTAGYAISIAPWGNTLGWLAGLLAVMTAYIRTLGASIGAPVSFMGPMAKQHRMAVITVAALISIIESFLAEGAIAGYAFLLALIVIAIGSTITSIKRTMAIYNFLEKTSS